MPLKKELARHIHHRTKSLCDEAEVYINTVRHLQIDVLDGKIESLDNVTEGGLSLRVIKDKKMGFAYTADFDEHSIEQTLNTALSNMKDSPHDPYFGFPEPRAQNSKISFNEKEIQAIKLSDKVAFAMEMEKVAFSSDKRIKRSEKISYQDSHSSVVIMNSKGVDLLYEKNVCGASARVIAEHGAEMEMGSWMRFATRFSDLDAAQIGSEAANRAVCLLGAGREKSGKAPVILSPFAGSMLIAAMVPALSADFVQKGKSLFCSALEKRVASKALNIMDSGIMQDGVASVPYDDEGTPTRETIVINDGFLRSYLHSNYTARKAKVSATANAFRGTYMQQPEITPTNLYVKPGQKSGEQLLRGVTRGFLVTNIMGAHTINPVSGDFSIGFSGFLIENGRTGAPVKEMTIAGNLLDLFMHIEDVGNDLLFFPSNGNIGSPSILISNLSVSGN